MMFATPDTLVSANKAAIENYLTLANTAFASTERLSALNLNAGRSFLEDGIANVRALLGVKEPQQLLALQSTLAQPAVEKLVSYSRSVYEIASQVQGEVSKIVEAQFSEVKESVSSVLDKASKNAPAGSEAAIAAFKSAFAGANSVYDNISKATKQVVEIAEANLASATNAAVKTTGAASKAKKAA
jgi:phasin family protein